MWSIAVTPFGCSAGPGAPAFDARRGDAVERGVRSHAAQRPPGDAVAAADQSDSNQADPADGIGVDRETGG